MQSACIVQLTAAPVESSPGGTCATDDFGRRVGVRRDCTPELEELCRLRVLLAGGLDRIFARCTPRGKEHWSPFCFPTRSDQTVARRHHRHHRCQAGGRSQNNPSAIYVSHLPLGGFLRSIFPWYCPPSHPSFTCLAQDTWSITTAGSRVNIHISCCVEYGGK